VVYASHPEGGPQWSKLTVEREKEKSYALEISNMQHMWMY